MQILEAKNPKYMSTELPGDELVILPSNSIDFLFILTAEQKGRTVNKRIMLLPHWHTVMSSPIKHE